MSVCKCPKCHSTKSERVNIKSGGELIYNRRCKSCGEYYFYHKDVLGKDI